YSPSAAGLVAVAALAFARHLPAADASDLGAGPGDCPGHAHTLRRSWVRLGHRPLGPGLPLQEDAMIVVGFVLFAAAIVIAVALIAQNPATVTVHAFDATWNVDMRWLLVAGLALTAIGLLGLSMMRLGSARYMRLRGERRALAAENKR